MHWRKTFFFRDSLHSHEKELERTSQNIKELIKEVKNLVGAAKNLSRAQRSLSDHLINFKFDCIGSNQVGWHKYTSIILCSMASWWSLPIFYYADWRWTGHCRKPKGDGETDIVSDILYMKHSLQVSFPTIKLIGIFRAIEDERSRMLERAFDNFIVPLEIFRKDQVAIQCSHIKCIPCDV